MSPPAHLGRVTIAPDETLGQLIQLIYGRFSPAHVAAIQKANPHITNPDRLRVGEVVHFPASPCAVQPLPVTTWWVQLAEFRRLSHAVQALKRQRAENVAARLLPYWNPDRGLLFALLLNDCYYDYGAALRALEQNLTEPGDAKAVGGLYRDDTVYFSDPFQVDGDWRSNVTRRKWMQRA